MLRVEGLSAGYSELPVLNDVSITVNAGEFVAIVGPNGAGKTTLFKTISGIVAPTAGRIAVRGRGPRRRCPPPRRPHLGIAHVPEGRQVFPSLTVLENLEMGAFTEAGRRNWKAEPGADPHLVAGAGRPALRSSPARCRAASSRCWRSDAASRRRRSC